ncbi:MAG: hypothetical protein AB3N13_12380 [Arenibacterium sp.]
MRTPIFVVLLASLILTSCGWRNNRDAPSDAAKAEEINPLIPRRRSLAEREERPDRSVLIGSIAELRVEPTPAGAIVYASGIADRQGAFRARLVPDNADLTPVDGVLNFTFRVEYPRNPSPVGTEASRTIHEAYTVTEQTLAQVRAIRVSGERNAKESRRRR